MKSMQKQSAYHAPLYPLDSATQTVGCRHTNPNICANNSLQGICAFVRKDNICLKPPRTWRKQFEKLCKEMSDSRFASSLLDKPPKKIAKTALSPKMRSATTRRSSSLRAKPSV
jgi:hypothetical protein